MEHDYEKNGENIYFACRKRASVYDERLNSREYAAERLGVSVSTLANYELGVTKRIPVDMVVMMADLYNAPELKNSYCKHDCPIGRFLPLATETDSLQGITIRILNSLDDDQIRKIKQNLITIAADGKIDDREKPQLQGILQYLDKMSLAVSELRMLAENIAERSGGDGTH